MRLNQFFLTTIVSLAIIPFLFIGCDDDDNVTTTNISIQFDQTIDGQTVQLNQNYDINGTTVAFNRIQFYVSQLELIRSDSTGVLIEDQYFLYGPDANTFNVGEVSTDEISLVRFNVGIDPAANNISETDFASYPSDSPLAAKNPSMHWNWNSGYKFFVLEGLTDSDGDGTPETDFVFHIGSDPFLRQVILNAPSIASNTQAVISVSLQLDEVLSNVDMATEFDTHTANNIDLATRIANNFQNAFQAIP